MTSHNLQELLNVVNEVPLKEMDLDAKYYRVISIHGETLADCPTIHYAKYFSRFSPKVVGELLLRLMAAERGARQKQQRAARETVKAYVITGTTSGTTLYYMGQAVDTVCEEATVYEWGTSIEEAFPFLRERDANTQCSVLRNAGCEVLALDVHHYNFPM